jgi:hypothetical protein
MPLILHDKPTNRTENVSKMAIAVCHDVCPTNGKTKLCVDQVNRLSTDTPGQTTNVWCA